MSDNCKDEVAAAARAAREKTYAEIITALTTAGFGTAAHKVVEWKKISDTLPENQ